MFNDSRGKHYTRRVSNVKGIVSFVCGIFRDARRDSYTQLAILEEILSIASSSRAIVA